MLQKAAERLKDMANAMSRKIFMFAVHMYDAMYYAKKCPRTIDFHPYIRSEV